MKKKKKRYFNKLTEKYIVEDFTPPCPYFPQCGGCFFQNISYENQLKVKIDYLNDLFEGMITVEEIHPSNPFAYRTRMDFVTAFGKCGLRQGGNFRNVIDIDNCLITQEKSNHCLKTFRGLIDDIDDYDYLKHEGYLRYIVLRESTFGQQVMCNLVIKEPDNRLEKIINTLEPQVDSMSLLLSDGLADLSFGPVFETIKQGYIEEIYDDVKYRITPNSFFQSNSSIAKIMYKRIKDLVQGRVLDLYSGVGSISLYVAENAEHVTGVEIIEEAVETANINKEINNIDNVNFICSDVLQYIKEETVNFDTVILDPPRSGIHPKTMKALIEAAPPRIIYMSCNPATFKDDLIALENYNMEFFEAYDMFPQTPHVETLALLTKK